MVSVRAESRTVRKLSMLLKPRTVLDSARTDTLRTPHHYLKIISLTKKKPLKITNPLTLFLRLFHRN